MTKADPFDSTLTKVAAKALAKRPGTDDLFAKAAELGVNPFETLLHLADGNALALDLEDGKTISPELRAMAARECLKYLYPTMKQSEVSGKDGGPLDLSVKVLFGKEGEEEIT